MGGVFSNDDDGPVKQVGMFVLLVAFAGAMKVSDGISTAGSKIKGLFKKKDK